MVKQQQQQKQNERTISAAHVHHSLKCPWAVLRHEFEWVIANINMTSANALTIMCTICVCWLQYELDVNWMWK